MEGIYQWISSLQGWAPAFCVVLFLIASLLVIWRLEVLSGQGVEGTVLGTVFMPFCSGMGNLVFAVVLATSGGEGDAVFVNSLFNNVTNLTLLIALPVLFWGMQRIPRKKSQVAIREHKMGRLSLSLNLVAVFCFSLFVLLLSFDGTLSRSDGAVLLLLFLFWQCFHIYDVKKTNLLKKKRYPATLPVEVILLLLGAGAVYISTDWLVQWFQSLEFDGAPEALLGWASGVLMVLPNALLAFYYGARRRMDVVYTSQAGDAHICIPLCIGLFAVMRPMETGPFVHLALWILMALCGVHLLFLLLLGRMPRLAAVGLLAAFGCFVWWGLRQ